MLKIETKHYTIEFTEENYAYFEHNELGDERGGGLWFKDNELIDYDGVYSLSKQVIQALEEKGYNMDYAKD